MSQAIRRSKQPVASRSKLRQEFSRSLMIHDPKHVVPSDQTPLVHARALATLAPMILYVTKLTSASTSSYRHI